MLFSKQTAALSALVVGSCTAAKFPMNVEFHTTNHAIMGVKVENIDFSKVQMKDSELFTIKFKLARNDRKNRRPDNDLDALHKRRRARCFTINFPRDPGFPKGYIKHERALDVSEPDARLNKLYRVRVAGLGGTRRTNRTCFTFHKKRNTIVIQYEKAEKLPKNAPRHSAGTRRKRGKVTVREMSGKAKAEYKGAVGYKIDEHNREQAQQNRDQVQTEALQRQSKNVKKLVKTIAEKNALHAAQEERERKANDAAGATAAEENMSSVQARRTAQDAATEFMDVWGKEVNTETFIEDNTKTLEEGVSEYAEAFDIDMSKPATAPAPAPMAVKYAKTAAEWPERKPAEAGTPRAPGHSSSHEPRVMRRRIAERLLNAERR